MITEKQRRRALARAKWERQQAKRSAAQARNRVVGIVFGVAALVVVVALVGWGVQHLLSNDDSNPGNQPPFTIPSNTLTMKTPTNTSFVTSYNPSSPTGTGSATSPGATKTTSSTQSAPVTTGSTGKASR